MAKSITSLLNLKTDGSVTCPACGEEVPIYLAPDYRHKGQYFRIPGTCTCNIRKAVERIEVKKAETSPPDTTDATIRLSGVTERYLSAKPYGVFADFVETFDRYHKSGAGLYITGKRDTGKTWAASAIAIALIKAGFTAQIKNSAKLTEFIKSSQGSSHTSGYITESMTFPDLLVIDDLGKEQVTDYSMKQLYTIINERYENMRPIIITTQYNSREIMAHWSKSGDDKTAQAIMRRLYDTCLAVDMNEIKREAS
jgi:DNA replication protein DnaC